MHSRAAELITKLNLEPHPEGGYYREIFRSSGCTVGPGFDFADFSLLADDASTAAAPARLRRGPRVARLNDREVTQCGFCR